MTFGHQQEKRNSDERLSSANAACQWTVGTRSYLVRIGLSDSDDIRRVAGVTRVENAAQFVVAAEERVGFADEQRRPHFLDHTEEGRRADVRCRNRAVCEPAQNAEQRGLATTFFRRLDAKVSADIAQFECIGVENPEGESE